MYCTRCGEQLPENSRFCSKCGSKIGLIKDFDKCDYESFIITEEKNENENFVDENIINKDSDEYVRNKESIPIENLFENKKVNLESLSPAPLDDGLRSYNFLYLVGFILFGLIGNFNKRFDIEIFLLLGVLGLLLAFVIKSTIANSKALKLRFKEFNLPYNIDNSNFINSIILDLNKLDMFVERDGDSLCIKHKGIIYDVILSNDSFTLWWSLPFFKLIFSRVMAIHTYRNIVVSMGLISYSIQKSAYQNLKVCEFESTLVAEAENENEFIAGQYDIPRTKKRYAIAAIALVVFSLYLLAGNEDSESTSEVTSIKATTEESHDFYEIKGEQFEIPIELQNLVRVHDRVLYITDDPSIPYESDGSGTIVPFENEGILSIAWIDYLAIKKEFPINVVEDNLGKIYVVIDESKLE